MRPQQKSFVVEIKSKGRRTSAQQGSIWGTTDLKALVRQAASVAPQLFEKAPNAPEPEVVETIPSNAVGTTQPDAARSADDVVSPENTTESTEADVAMLTVPAEVQLPDETARPAFRSRKSPRRKRKPAALMVSLPLAPTEGQADDLVILEAENAELRSRWTERLRSQNLVLSAMLERFA